VPKFKYQSGNIKALMEGDFQLALYILKMFKCIGFKLPLLKLRVLALKDSEHISAEIVIDNKVIE
jgi:Na+/pantothenate symporter